VPQYGVVCSLPPLWGGAGKRGVTTNPALGRLPPFPDPPHGGEGTKRVDDDCHNVPRQIGMTFPGTSRP